MSKTNAPKNESAREMTKMSVQESTHTPSFPREEITRLLRSANRDFHAAIRMLDSIRQSEVAGRLHALSVELRELAAETETESSGDGSNDSMPGRYLQ